jgi:pimeloyl-ACP methyl ester carboxylesterase
MIKARTLIVRGDQDARYMRIEEEALASAIGGSRLIVHPGTGHLLHWEERERFASDFDIFIQALG